MYLTSIKNAFKNYFNFKGRATRVEFWPFFLLVAILAIFEVIVSRDLADYQILILWILHIAAIISLVLCAIPFLSASWRRFHDVGKSGFFTLFILIPLVGIIFYVIWMAMPSDNDNEFGPAKNE